MWEQGGGGGGGGEMGGLGRGDPVVIRLVGIKNKQG